MMRRDAMRTTVQRTFRRKACSLQRAGDYRAALNLFFIPAIFLLVAGCVSTRSQLTIKPMKRSVAYDQDFAHCYAMRDVAGDYQFYLVQDGMHSPLDQKPGEPLQPIASSPLHQIVHVHVFWRPMRGTKPDNPSSTNASIDWYFISNQGLARQSVLRYEGSGFVRVHPSTRTVAVHVRSASMYPVGSAGSLRDPLAASNVSGDFLARFDPGMVRQLAEQVKELNH